MTGSGEGRNPERTPEGDSLALAYFFSTVEEFVEKAQSGNDFLWHLHFPRPSNVTDVEMEMIAELYASEGQHAFIGHPDARLADPRDEPMLLIMDDTCFDWYYKGSSESGVSTST